MANKEPAKAHVLQGTLDLMVLQTLLTLGPLHGYAIASRLEQVSTRALRLNMGPLYPGLMRLEQRGLVRARWGVTDNNRKARFYAITAAGTRRLATKKAERDRTAPIMHKLLREQAGPAEEPDVHAPRIGEPAVGDASQDPDGSRPRGGAAAAS